MFFLFTTLHLQAQDFLSKAANENKAIEFRLESQDTKDICNIFSNSLVLTLFPWTLPDCSTMSNNSSLFLFICLIVFGHNIICLTHYLRWFLKRPQAMEFLIHLLFQCMTWLSKWRRRATWISRSVATLFPVQWLFSVELNLTGVVWVLLDFNKHQQLIRLKGVTFPLASRITLEHASYSVYKPNPVQVSKAKGTNIAGLLGYKLPSYYLTHFLLWVYCLYCLRKLFTVFVLFVYCEDVITKRFPDSGMATLSFDF